MRRPNSLDSRSEEVMNPKSIGAWRPSSPSCQSCGEQERSAQHTGNRLRRSALGEPELIPLRQSGRSFENGLSKNRTSPAKLYSIAFEESIQANLPQVSCAPSTGAFGNGGKPWPGSSLRFRLRRFHKTTSLLGSPSRNHSSTPPLGGERTSLERETSYPQDAALARSGRHQETGSCGPAKRHDDGLADSAG